MNNLVFGLFFVDDKVALFFHRKDIIHCINGQMIDVFFFWANSVLGQSSIGNHANIFHHKGVLGRPCHEEPEHRWFIIHIRMQRSCLKSQRRSLLCPSMEPNMNIRTHKSNLSDVFDIRWRTRVFNIHIWKSKAKNLQKMQIHINYCKKALQRCSIRKNNVDIIVICLNKWIHDQYYWKK